MIDITPEHLPVSLAREMEKRAQNPNVDGAFALLSFKDGHIWYDANGVQKQAVLYGLFKCILALMDDDGE